MVIFIQYLPIFPKRLVEAGEPINDKFATIVNGLWANKLSDDKLKDKFRKYPNPSNCNYMKIPKCNPEIWPGSCMNSNARSTDKKLLHRLLGLLRDQLTTSQSKEKRIFPSSNAGCIYCFYRHIGQTIQDINQLRRDLVKPKLPFRLQKLAANVEWSAAELFGDDLNKRIKAINETSKALVRNRVTVTVLRNKRTTKGGQTFPINCKYTLDYNALKLDLISYKPGDIKNCYAT